VATGECVPFRNATRLRRSAGRARVIFDHKQRSKARGQLASLALQQSAFWRVRAAGLCDAADCDWRGDADERGRSQCTCIYFIGRGRLHCCGRLSVVGRVVLFGACGCTYRIEYCDIGET
jgi:hypothetical protein